MPRSEHGTSLKPLIARFAAYGAAALVLGVLAMSLMRLLPDSGHAAIGGPFELVDQNGATVTDKTFRGRLMLVYFGYTFCPDVCPTALSTMADAYDALSADERKQVALIFITVDPERDGVEQMADYVANFSPALTGLTGGRPAIDKVMREYKVFARRAGGEGDAYTMDHSSILYLMDRNGRFVSHFTHTTAVADIVAGIRKAL